MPFLFPAVNHLHIMKTRDEQMHVHPRTLLLLHLYVQNNMKTETKQWGDKCIYKNKQLYSNRIDS